MNSPESVTRLVAGHRDFLAFLERRVESREVAEDILQTAFVKGLEHAAEVPDEKVVAWFYRVLRNAVVDHYRRRAVSAGAQDALAHEFPDRQEPDGGLEAEICQCVTGMLDTLKPEYRDAIRMVDLEDLSLADFAERSGISANNAAVRVHRARATLRTQVQRACGTCAEHGCLNCSCGSGRCR